jgi:hypothetical protein
MSIKEGEYVQAKGIDNIQQNNSRKFPKSQERYASKLKKE